MIQLIETYTWKQAAVKSKLGKLSVELDTVSFLIDSIEEDIYTLSQYAAIEGMKIFAQRVEESWQTSKNDLLIKHPKFDFEKRFKIKILDQPVGQLISFDEFVGFDYKTEDINIHDYTGCELAQALLSPPYSIGLKIEADAETHFAVRTREYTKLYRTFLNDFILLSEYGRDVFEIFRWSDDWSNYFDAGKEWWGTYFWTVYNKQNNTIIVLGASATD